MAGDINYLNLLVGKVFHTPFTQIPPTLVCFTNLDVKARKTARIRNRCNEVPHLSNTLGKCKYLFSLILMIFARVVFKPL